MKNKHLLKVISILAILVVALLVLFFLFYKDVRSKNENISKLSSDLQSEILIEDYSISTQKTLQSYSNEISTAKSDIIQSTDDLKFIKDVELVAKQNGLTVSIDSINLENDPKISSSTTTFLKVKARTSGSWQGTYRFIMQLENFPYKIKINSLTMSSGGQNDSEDGKVNSKKWDSIFEIRAIKYK